MGRTLKGREGRAMFMTSSAKTWKKTLWIQFQKMEKICLWWKFKKKWKVFVLKFHQKNWLWTFYWSRNWSKSFFVVVISGDNTAAISRRNTSTASHSSSLFQCLLYPSVFMTFLLYRWVKRDILLPSNPVPISLPHACHE